jgi:RNA polymerase sigma-70 factor, ECF subfamily
MNKLSGELPLQCSDADLVPAAQAGDAMAFDRLILRHQERVYALAYHILGNAEDAADVQQETFVQAWTKLAAFRGDAAFATWLHRIAVNICIRRKRRSRPQVSLDRDETPDIAGPADCEDQLVNAVVVRELLAGIPLRQRTLLVLREVEGMSIAEIAEVTGSSVEAVRKQLWRVRKLFGKRLRQHLMENEQ